MSSQTIGLLIGGLLPALLFAICNLFVKASNNAGIGVGPYMIIIGAAVIFMGMVFLLFIPDRTLSLRSGLHAFGMGIFWGTGVGLVAIGISWYGAPIGKLSSLFNMNSFFTVLLAFWIFAEWKQVHVPRLLLGSLLIAIGGTLVAKS